MAQLVRMETGNDYLLAPCSSPLAGRCRSHDCTPHACEHQLCAGLPSHLLGQVIDQEPRQRHLAALMARFVGERHHTVDKYGAPGLRQAYLSRCRLRVHPLNADLPLDVGSPGPDRAVAPEREGCAIPRLRCP